MKIRNNVKISICIAVKNNKKKLQKCLNSILNQTYKNYEINIVDGKSIDGSQSVIKNYKNKINNFISEKDTGIYSAFNKLINLSTGEFICFLGSDDYFINNNSLKNLINSCEIDNYDFISSQILLYDDNKLHHTKIGKKFIYSNLIYGMKFVHSSALTRSSILKKNKFDEKYKISGDFDLMVRVGKNIRSFFYNKPTIYYYSGGISRSKVSIANYECFLSLRHNKNFGLFKSLFFIFHTKFKIIIKKYIYA
tara:strand:+ start:2099 stop:2851 length:753 start_codon:yes stop_codon:yes gene_type:complete